MDFISWTKNFPLDVRFIEFMPFTGNAWLPEKVFSYKEMLNSISTKYEFLKLEDAITDTAKKHTVAGHAGTFAFITTITESFCGACNRLRLTADGKMKNCLFSQNETDLFTAMRKGEDITPLILSCLENKKRERGGRFDLKNAVGVNSSIALNTAFSENRSMIRIGG